MHPDAEALPSGYVEAADAMLAAEQVEGGGDGVAWTPVAGRHLPG
jgi:hypothetical protein